MLFRDEAHKKTGKLVIASTWFLFSAQACVLPHLTRYYDLDLGLEDQQIGLLMAAPAFVSLMFQPIWGAVADRYLGRTYAFRYILLISSLLLILLSVAHSIGGYAPLLTTACLFIACMGSTIPLSSAIILSYLGARQRHLFGRIRAFGSGSFCFTIFFLCPFFVLISQKMGLPDRTFVFWCASIFYLITLSCTGWDEKQFEKHEKPPFSSFLLLVKNIKLLLFYFTIYVTAVGAAAGIQYIGPYIGHRGYSEFFFSSIWFFGVGVEIIFTYKLDKFVRILGIKTILVAGFAADGFRWLGLSQVSSPLLMILFFALHGPAVIGLFFASAMYLDSECEEKVRSTAQAILYFSIVAGQITGYMLGSTIVDGYSLMSRDNAIQHGFFWFGFPGITAALLCVLFVSSGEKNKAQ